MTRAGKLGTVDSQLGNMQLALAGAEPLHPLTGTKTGKLGTVYSMLGNVRPALGEEEGTATGGSTRVSAENTLALVQFAASQTVCKRSATSELALSDLASQTRVVNVSADNLLAITDDVGLATGTWGYSVSSGSVLSLAAEARAALGAWLHEVVAESMLGIVQAASGAIGSVINLAASTTLALTQEAVATEDEWAHDLSAASELDCIQEATATAGHWVYDVSADTALALAQEAVGGFIHNLVAVSSLDLTQETSGGFILDVSADSIVLFGQEAIGLNVHVYEVEAESWLESLIQGADTVNVLRLASGNTLSLGQSLHVVRPWYITATSVLQETHQEFIPGTIDIIEVTTGLNSSAAANIVANRMARSMLSMSQASSYSIIHPGGIFISADSTLDLVQSAWITQLVYAVNTLLLGQMATAYTGPTLGSQIDLAQSAGVTLVRNRNATSCLELDHSVTYVLLKHGAVDLFDYAPAGLPPLQGPYSGITSRFGLIYPADGPATDTVELRPPNLGNKDRLSFDRINRESRGGTLTVFADPNWPKVQTLALTFSGLHRTEAYELIRFVREHLGLEIKLSDWEQRVWRGVITTPDEPVVQDGKDSFSASFEFEGELLSV